MRKYFRASSTVEVMVILVAMSFVISVSYSAQANMYQAYQDIVHRERAQLYALETFEQLESLRLTRRQQNYPRSWDAFLGSLDDGQYQIHEGNHPSDLALLPIELTTDDSSSIREYFSEGESEFYSRLERRIFLSSDESLPSSKRVLVSVYWGIPGYYSDHHIDQVRLEAVYSDETGPSFVL